MLRLPKRHDSKRDEHPAPDPRSLLAAQSPARAAAAGSLALLGCALFWLLGSLATGRVFPWFSIVQGGVIGLVVRRYGLGLDWRFPALAAALAFLGAFVGNLVLAIPTTTSELGATPFEVLGGLTLMSFDIFFNETMTPVDYIYAFCAAALAAFYARRRLDRYQEYALRTMGTQDSQ